MEKKIEIIVVAIENIFKNEMKRGFIKRGVWPTNNSK